MKTTEKNKNKQILEYHYFEIFIKQNKSFFKMIYSNNANSVVFKKVAAQKELRVLELIEELRGQYDSNVIYQCITFLRKNQFIKSEKIGREVVISLCEKYSKLITYFSGLTDDLNRNIYNK